MNEGIDNNRKLNGGAPLGWGGSLPKAIECSPNMLSDRPTVYAIISTWNDADIIGASVRNCFNQGASKVFLLDNKSDDQTVEIAIDAGATVSMIYETKFYDDDLRMKHQNDIIERETAAASLPELWWFSLDSDEFPTSMDGYPIIDHLRGLPREIRTIGTNFIDLYPTEGKHHEASRHPASCMDFGIWRLGGIRRYCECGHWKHAIFRLFNGVRDIANSRGNHAIAVPPVNAPTVLESSFEFFMFHAPIRGKEATFARLEKLCASGRSQWDDQVTRSQGAIKRWKALEDIYSGRWDRVEMPHTQMYGRNVKGIALYQWRKMIPGFSDELLF